MQYAVIAAGQGRRLAPTGVAKPLAPIGGEPMIARLLRAFANCGAPEVTVVADPDRHEVIEFLQSGSMPVDVSVIKCRSASPLQSLGAALTGIKPGKFILTTADTVFDTTSFARYVHTFAAIPDPDGLMAVTRHDDDEKALYVITDDNGRITAFSDTPAGNSRVSAGIYGLHTAAAVRALSLARTEGDGRLRDFQRALLRCGTHLTTFDIGTAVDVDRPADLDLARKIFGQR